MSDWQKQETGRERNLKLQLKTAATRIAELDAEVVAANEEIGQLTSGLVMLEAERESTIAIWKGKRIRELEAALKPFAEWSRKLDAEFGDHEDDVIAGGISGGLSVTFGDLRGAARALSDPSGERPEPMHCDVPSCAQPVRVGIIRWEARYPVLVTDLLGRTYCPTCNRTYKENK